MVITSEDLTCIQHLKISLSQQFEMKNLGFLTYLLGHEVSLDSISYYLSQAKYTSNLLDRAGLADNKTTFVPKEPDTHFTPLEGK